MKRYFEGLIHYPSKEEIARLVKEINIDEPDEGPDPFPGPISNYPLPPGAAEERAKLCGQGLFELRDENSID